MDNKDCQNCKFWYCSTEEYPCSECSWPSCTKFESGYPEPPKCHCLGVNEPNAEDKTVFPSGAVRDNSNGKGRMDLLPWTAIMEVSKHCQKGAQHYGEHNVDRGIPLSSLCDSGARHLAKFIDGWDDEDHLVAAAWNILWAIQMREKKPECIDVPWRNNNG